MEGTVQTLLALVNDGLLTMNEATLLINGKNTKSLSSIMW